MITNLNLIYIFIHTYWLYFYIIVIIIFHKYLSWIILITHPIINEYGINLKLTMKIFCTYLIFVFNCRIKCKVYILFKFP